jgi:peptide/nickel transport system substrate-binding protein
VRAPTGEVDVSRRRLALLAVAVAILTAAACALPAVPSILTAAAAAESPDGSPAASPVKLRIGSTGEADNLNPFIGYAATSYEVWHLNYDLLVGYSAKDYSPAPEFAESWSVSPDGRTWTFKIRPGMKWQDGKPATARDAAFTYNYIIDNDMTAFSSFTKHIVKAVAADDLTLRIVCDAPKANMLRLWIPILPEHIWSKVDPKEAGERFANEPPIVGSGPFQCVEWKKGQYVRLTANPDYWGGRPRIDEVLFLSYQDRDAMVQELKAGLIDGAYGVPPAQLQRLGTMPGVKAISYTTPTWDYLSFNCYAGRSKGNPVLRDPAFRRALAWAVDKDSILKIAYGGLAEKGSTIVPPGTGGASAGWHWEPPTDQAIGFDMARAKQLLDESGYVDTDFDGIRENPRRTLGPDVLDIELRLWARSESDSSQKAGKLIAGRFAQLGLKVHFEVMDEGALSDKVYNFEGGTYVPDYDMYLWDFVGYQDAGDTLACFTSEQVQLWNDPCWANAEYDRLNERQQSELDAGKRRALLRRMQEVFYGEVPEVVIAYPQDLAAYDTSRWTGWVRAPRPDGGAFYTNNNMATYLRVRPRAVPAPAGAAGPPAWAWALVAAAGAVVLGGAVLLLHRRSRPPEEE